MGIVGFSMGAFGGTLIWLFATPWTVACQAPLPMGFSRQEYWSGFLWPPLGTFPTQGLNLGLLHFRQIFYFFLPSELPGKPISKWNTSLKKKLPVWEVPLKCLTFVSRKNPVGGYASVNDRRRRACRPWTGSPLCTEAWPPSRRSVVSKEPRAEAGQLPAASTRVRLWSR